MNPEQNINGIQKRMDKPEKDFRQPTERYSSDFQHSDEYLFFERVTFIITFL
jgi:hypothetical protein